MAFGWSKALKVNSPNALDLFGRALVKGYSEKRKVT